MLTVCLRPALLAAAFLVSGVCAGRLFATDTWTAVRSQHIAVYTPNPAADAAELIRKLEQVRCVLTGARLVGPNPISPVRVIAFRDSQEFALYRLSTINIAYYQRGPGGDTIVLQDLAPDHFSAAVHEYVHHVLNSSGHNLPLWLEEGLAAHYSGSPAPRPLSRMPIQLSELFAATTESAVYNDLASVSAFYAESAFVAGLLVSDAKYAASFTLLLADVDGTQSTEQSLRRVYGKSVAALASELGAERRHPHEFRGFASLPSEQVEMHWEALSDLRVQLTLDRLMASHPATAPTAFRRLLELQAEYPADRELKAALAEVAEVLLRSRLFAVAGTV